MEDDNLLLAFFFGHCLIQLDSQAIPSLKHTKKSKFSHLIHYEA